MKPAADEIKDKNFIPLDVFERITDAFIALDTEYCFTYVNKKAGEIYKRLPKSLIRKNIWTEFADDLGNAFYQAVERANKTQKPVYIENYYPVTGKWFENHIYPSYKGISIYFRDITDKKKMEIALKKSEEKYRLIIEQSNDAIFISDAKGRILEVNTQACKMSGYEKTELLTKTLFDLIPPEGRKKATILEFFHEKKSIYLEGQLMRKDGSKLFVEISSQLTPNDEIVAVSRDITERKKAETELREAEEKFRSLVEKSLVGVYIIQNGRFAYVNPKLAEIYDYKQSELMGASIALLVKDSEEMKMINDFIRARLAGEKDAVHYEMVGKKKDGTLLQIEVFGSRTQYGGKPAIIGTLINVTERKQAEDRLRESEQKYKLLFEGNPLPMWMFSKTDFSIIDVNEAACKHYGYTRDEFLRMSIKDMRPPEDVPVFIKEIKLYAQEKMHLGIWRHQKKDGTIINVEVLGHDVIYQGQTVRLALANDITEKVAAEERLKQSYEEIRQLTEHLQNIREEERSHIAREIHDELGQQLTVLKMDVAWIGKKLGTTNEPVKQKITDLLEVLDNTVKIVRRIASELRPSLLDDLGLIAAMDWHLREFQKRSGIKTEFVEPGSDLTLNDNVKTGLFRILQESLTNVARHSKAKKVKVELAAKDKHVVLCIEDDGIGFDKEKTNQQRTLGILGMKERSAMMGGKYDISSIPGSGTKVVVCVPC